MAKWRVAGLLWPESPEATARNNLRQLLHRLTGLLGAACVEPGEPLRLRSLVTVDVIALRNWLSVGDYAEAIAQAGGLLEGHRYEDCPALEHWIYVQRGLVHRMQCRAHKLRVSQLEQAGQLDAALLVAKRWLALDTLSEDAYRCVMRFHCLLDEYVFAWAAFEQCRRVLRHELNMEPSAETDQLAEAIRSRGHVRQESLRCAQRDTAPPEGARYHHD